MDVNTYHPYRNRVFWVVFLVSMGVSLIGAITTYYFLSLRALHFAQQDLETIATKTARLVPMDIHEQLRNPEDLNSANYKTVENILKSVMAGNPKIDDIYTLRPTVTPHVYSFVVSGKDSVDANHNGTIDDDETKAMLGENYDATDQPYLEQGLHEPTYDRKITYDKWGAWISGYAPLRTPEGEVVGVLGVDYSASVITDQRSAVAQQMGIVALGLVPMSALAGFVLSRRTQRPFQRLARAMDRIVHGEPDYRIPHEGNHDDIAFAHFFNSTIDVIRDSLRSDANKQKKKSDSE